MGERALLAEKQLVQKPDVRKKWGVYGNGLKVLPTRAERNSAWDKMRLGKTIAFEVVRGNLWSLVFKIRIVESYCKVLCRGWHNQLFALKKSF